MCVCWLHFFFTQASLLLSSFIFNNSLFAFAYFVLPSSIIKKKRIEGKKYCMVRVCYTRQMSHFNIRTTLFKHIVPTKLTVASWFFICLRARSSLFIFFSTIFIHSFCIQTTIHIYFTVTVLHMYTRVFIFCICFTRLLSSFHQLNLTLLLLSSLFLSLPLFAIQISILNDEKRWIFFHKTFYS